jgi:hypothetical protein
LSDAVDTPQKNGIGDNNHDTTPDLPEKGHKT